MKRRKREKIIIGSKELTLIGRNDLVEFVGHATNVPAKVDTGADSSSVWASHIQVGADNVLRFNLFDKGSQYYTGEVIERSNYSVAIVRSASGHEQIRYRVLLILRINGRRVRAVFNLSDRSKNVFPVLVGRRTLQGKFVVDVLRSSVVERSKVFENENGMLNDELIRNPQAFYLKYFGKNIEKMV